MPNYNIFLCYEQMQSNLVYKYCEIWNMASRQFCFIVSANDLSSTGLCSVVYDPSNLGFNGSQTHYLK